jgi:putative transcriptional regulator
MTVHVDIERLLVERRMSVGEFAAQVGITPANVAVLKNGRARAIRFSTLDAICRVLECQPGDVLVWSEDRRPTTYD